MGLPDGTGHDLMQQLVASGRHIPAIALSGYGTAADMERSRAVGFLEHITKPVNLPTLLGAIARASRAHLARGQ